MVKAPAGYSGKSLDEKLGLKAGVKAAAINPPAHYATLLADPPGAFGKGQYDLIHLFAPERAALTKQLPRALKQLGQGGAIWVSWPKKTSPLFKDLTEDGVRELALPLGVVDVKVCAVDQDWSGLKLMRRRMR
jgi:Protein of unknown function (DUF3052)